MLDVIKAEYVAGYTMRVTFSTGESGEVDLTDALWGPVFEPLRDPAVFRRFQISPVLHTVVWENGADLAPEALRVRMLGQASAARAVAEGRGAYATGRERGDSTNRTGPRGSEG